MVKCGVLFEIRAESLKYYLDELWLQRVELIQWLWDFWLYLTLPPVASVIRCLLRLPLDPRLAGWNPAEDDGFLRAIKIYITTSFEMEVKPTALCRKILWHVKEPCGVGRRYFVGKIGGHFSPIFLQGVSAGCYQRALVDELEIIRTQMGNAQHTYVRK
jgi:hypothetical protein